MNQTCSDCGKSYDDARCWTICPHEPLRESGVETRWDKAMTLLGETVVFVHLPDKTPHRVSSVNFDGMVGLADKDGLFYPSQFQIVESK